MSNETNVKTALISDEAYGALKRLLTGDVIIPRPQTWNETEPDANGDTKLDGKLRVREGLVSIGRTIYHIYVLRELEALGLVDEEGELTTAARRTYRGLVTPLPANRKIFVGAR